MATIPKATAIHSKGHLKNALEYIQKAFKTKDKILVDGFNCCINPTLSKEQFLTTQEMFKTKKYKDTNKKEILAHHFSQNFNPKDNVTPEVAFEIAKETVKKHFGDDFQVMIATHVDKGHIHNHFIINSVSMKGEKYLAQGKTLSKMRKESDDICEKYGLSILDYSKHKFKNKGKHYKVWLEEQRGFSWKDKIKNNIDKALLKSENFEDLIKNLDELHYECDFFKNASGEKYLGIRDRKFKKKYFCNTKNLGEGYDLKSLEEKIKNKDLIYKDLPNTKTIDEATSNAKLDILYAKVKYTKVTFYKNDIRQSYKEAISVIINMILGRSERKIKPKKYKKNLPYSDKNNFYVQTLAKQLNYLNKHNINNIVDLETRKLKVKNDYDILSGKINILLKAKKDLNFKLENNIQDSTNTEAYKKIKQIDDSIEKVKMAIQKIGLELKHIEEIVYVSKEIELDTYVSNATVGNKEKLNDKER